MVDIGTAIDLKGAGFVVWDAVRLESHVSADLLAALLHIFKEESFHHTLMNEENVWIQYVDDGWVMDFATESA